MRTIKIYLIELLCWALNRSPLDGSKPYWVPSSDLNSRAKEQAEAFYIL